MWYISATLLCIKLSFEVLGRELKVAPDTDRGKFIMYRKAKQLLSIAMLSVLFIACDTNNNPSSTHSQSTGTMSKCSYCNGAGQVYCYNCNGVGVVNTSMLDPYSGMIMSMPQKCMTCNGNGVIKCPVCKGNGYTISFKGSYRCSRCDCEGFVGYGDYCSRCKHSWSAHNSL